MNFCEIVPISIAMIILLLAAIIGSRFWHLFHNYYYFVNNIFVSRLESCKVI